MPLDNNFVVICDMSHEPVSLIHMIIWQLNYVHFNRRPFCLDSVTRHTSLISDNLARVNTCSYVSLEDHFALMCDMSHETVSLMSDNLAS